MNIKRAKQEMKDTVEAYLLKDRYGEYCIPSAGQRPVLLMGPPGIGKTQIMEQIARECGINLVVCTIPRPSGQQHSSTGYPISESIASVYEKIEETGIQEGILFFDGIDCVSETLAPVMQQFFQCKTLGKQGLPKGWLLAGAGNLPEHRKAVWEFDVATLDRMKQIRVQEDFGVWKEYAYEAGIHGAVISYLNTHREDFYRMETGEEGRAFVTARGWEDLSQLLYVYEKLGKTVDWEVVIQYIQYGKTAKDFANYLELFEKYKAQEQIEAVLRGSFDTSVSERLRLASSDEKFSVVGLLLAKLSEDFREYHEMDLFAAMLIENLKQWKQDLSGERTAGQALKDRISRQNQELERKKLAGQVTREQEYTVRKVLEVLEGYRETVATMEILGEEKVVIFAAVRRSFQEEIQNRKTQTEYVRERLQKAFAFLEQTFGDGQETAVFVTELNINPYALAFISENGCDGVQACCPLYTDTGDNYDK